LEDAAMHLTQNEKDLLVVGIPAAATIVVGIIAALAAYLASKRERRRALYSEAIKAAVGWQEMLYRVRRREEGQERELISRFHDLQDQLTYYQAWVGSESAYMRRSYDELVGGVKALTEKSITKAWDEPVRPLPGNSLSSDDHPDVGPLTDRFLRDVRSHLSPWPWRKLAARSRNRDAT
jgi:hypothetical protein